LAARLAHITSEEGIQAEPAALEELVRISDGDMRKAVTLLETSHSMFGHHRIVQGDRGDVSAMVADDDDDDEDDFASPLGGGDSKGVAVEAITVRDVHEMTGVRRRSIYKY
jgi:DNA polymerase III delta prime subunit